MCSWMLWRYRETGHLGCFAGGPWAIYSSRPSDPDSPLLLDFFGACMNLLNQGIFTHFRSAFNEWSANVALFVDTRACSYGHGGWTGRPGSIIAFAAKPSHIPGALPINVDSAVGWYAHFFLFEYLPTVACAECGHDVQPAMLLNCLLNDPDSAELRTLVIEAAQGK